MVWREPRGTLHEGLLLHLVDQLQAGTWKVGEKLPTEAELTHQHGVSRTTARRALDELRRRGLVHRQAGRGTFVADPRLHGEEAFLSSFTDEIERLGYRAGVRVLRDHSARLHAIEAERLEVPHGAEVRRTRRLRTADGQPIFVCRSDLNTLAHPELSDVAADAPSLYRAMEEALGASVSHARQWVRADAADDETAADLGLEPGRPVLVVDRVTYLPPPRPLAQHRPVELVRAWFHPDRYQHFSELTARPSVVRLDPLSSESPEQLRPPREA